MNSLADRKRALVAESELYRQTLMMEIENLSAAGARMKRKLGLLRFLKPLLLLAPLAVSLCGFGSGSNEVKPRARGRRKWWASALAGWRLYRRTAPMVSHFMTRHRSRTSHHRRFGETTP